MATSPDDPEGITRQLNEVYADPSAVAETLALAANGKRAFRRTLDIEEVSQRGQPVATSPNDPQPRTARKPYANRPARIAGAPLTILADAGETCVGDECALPGAADIPVPPKPANA